MWQNNCHNTVPSTATAVDNANVVWQWDMSSSVEQQTVTELWDTTTFKSASLKKSVQYSNDVHVGFNPVEVPHSKIIKDWTVLIRWELYKTRMWDTVSILWLQHKLVFSLQQHCDTALFILNYPWAMRVGGGVVLFLLWLRRSQALWFSFPLTPYINPQALQSSDTSANNRHLKDERRSLLNIDQESTLSYIGLRDLKWS